MRSSLTNYIKVPADGFRNVGDQALNPEFAVLRTKNGASRFKDRPH